MFQIRKLETDEIVDALKIIFNSYPAFGDFDPVKNQSVEEYFIKSQKNDKDVDLWGYFEDEKIQGCMRIHHFNMYYGKVLLKSAGLGLVAVDLLHKKRKICKKMVDFFLNYAALKKMPIGALYAFRPDFYKKMGFGYGTKINSFIFKPETLPKKGSSNNLGIKYSYEIFEDKELYRQIVDCYNRSIENKHGAFTRDIESTADVLNFQKKSMIVVYSQKDKQINGYVVYKYLKDKNDNFLKNDIFIKEWICQNKTVFFDLVSFLNKQSDQIRNIIYNTYDENFFYIFDEVRSPDHELIEPVHHKTQTVGTGLMYRLTDFKLFFESTKNYNFNNFSGVIKFVLKDNFVDYNAGNFFVKFEEGLASLQNNENYDVQISLDIADFSSLVMGSITLQELYKYNLCDISKPELIHELNKIFQFDSKPVCYNLF